MPIEFSTSLERDLVYARWHGFIDFDQFLQNFTQYLGDVHYRPGRRELIDHAGITEFDINSSLIRTMLRHVNEQSSHVIVQTHTVIYSPHETIFGLGRMYQLLAEVADGIQVEVFQDEGEALAALELEHDSIEHLLSAETFLPYEPSVGGPE